MPSKDDYCTPLISGPGPEFQGCPGSQEEDPRWMLELHGLIRSNIYGHSLFVKIKSIQTGY